MRKKSQTSQTSNHFIDHMYIDQLFNYLYCCLHTCTFTLVGQLTPNFLRELHLYIISDTSKFGIMLNKSATVLLLAFDNSFTRWLFWSVGTYITTLLNKK